MPGPPALPDLLVQEGGQQDLPDQLGLPALPVLGQLVLLDLPGLKDLPGLGVRAALLTRVLFSMR